MDYKAADSDLSAETIDLSAEKLRDESKSPRDGVCLVPYLIITFIPRGIH